MGLRDVFIMGSKEASQEGTKKQQQKKEEQNQL